MVGFNKESGEVSVHREDAGRRVDGEADGERFKGRQGTEGSRPRGRRSHLRARKRFPLSMEV